MFNDLFPEKSKALILSAVLLAVIGKILSILEFGPLQLGPDTLFTETAQVMRSSWSWFWDAGLQTEAIPHSLWKTVGYSGLIAVFQMVFEEDWHWWLYGFQGTMSLVAGLYLYRLALMMGLHPLVSTLIFLLHQWSTPLSTDTMIATNSLDGSFATILLADAGWRFIRKAPLTGPAVAYYGALLSLCFLMRMTYEYWAVFAAAILTAFLYRSSGVWRVVLKRIGAFALVLLVTVGGYKSWNAMRSGYFISSTGGQTGYVLAIIRTTRMISNRPEGLIAGNTPFDRVLRDAVTDTSKNDYQLTKRVNEVLFTQHAMTGIDIQNMAQRRYKDLIAAYPLAWARVWLINGSWEHQSSLFSGPLRQYDELWWWVNVRAGDTESYFQGWRGEVRDFLQTRDPKRLSIEAIVHGGSRLALRFVGLALMVGLGLGTLATTWIWIRRGWSAERRTIMLSTFGWIYFLSAGMFAVIFVELRYLSPVIGVGILAAIAHAQWLMQITYRRIGKDAV